MKNLIQKLKTRLNRSKKSKGFTLVELIIVIALIAALSVAAVISYRSLSTSAEETLIKQEASFIVRTLNMYNSLLKSDEAPLTNTIRLSDLGRLKLTSGVGGNGLIDLDLSIEPGAHTTEAFERVMYAPEQGKWIISSNSGGFDLI